MWTFAKITTTLIQQVGDWKNSVGFSESKKQCFFFFVKSTWKSRNGVPFMWSKQHALNCHKMLDVTHTKIYSKKKCQHQPGPFFVGGWALLFSPQKGFLLNKTCWTSLTSWDFTNQIELSSRCCFGVSTQLLVFLFRFAQASFKLGTGLWDGKTGPEKEEWGLNSLRVKHEVEIDEYCYYLYICGPFWLSLLWWWK